ncbi:MAG: hypothetical protein JNN30_12875 [Rhodanobacteraceae bacterium]|nr:hypothetical protein [Rhodanobacteraceae bacterium]
MSENLQAQPGKLGGLFVMALAAALWAGRSEANRADLDPSFGNGGVVKLQLAEHSSLLDLAVQADGRIVGVGYASTGGSRQWAIVRFDTNGSLDSGFGINGAILLTPPAGASATTTARALTFDGAGNILVVGDDVILRLTPAGVPDASYGVAGFYNPPAPTVPLPYGEPGPYFADIALAESGGFIVSGSVVYGEGALYAAPHASVTKLTAAGIADTSFGNNASVFLPGNYPARLYSGTQESVQLGGAIYMADYEWDRFSQNQLPGVRKILASGSFDAVFGSGGYLLPFTNTDGRFNGHLASAIALQSGSRLIVAGTGGGYPFPRTAAVSRISALGQIDPTFTRFTMPEPSGSTGGKPKLLVDVDGRVIVAGWKQPNGAVVAGLLPDGAPDPDFGTVGIASLLVPFEGANSAAIARQADGKYLIAGSGDEGSSAAAIYVARLRGSAAIPPEISTVPAAGTSLSASGGLPGTTQSLGVVRFENSGGDDLVVFGCTASSGFSVTAAFPLRVTPSSPQSVAVSCQLPATPSTAITGTLVCTSNDADEPQLSFPLQCASGLGAPGPISIPTLGRGMQGLLGAVAILMAWFALRVGRRSSR